MFRRWGLFIGLNILIVVTISLILSFLGILDFGASRQSLFFDGLNYQSLIIFCLIWGMVGSFISLRLSKWMAKRLYNVQTLTIQGPYGALVSTVHRLARQAGLPVMPEVGIIQSHEVNAFATGPSKKNSLVVVTTGLLSHMGEEEVEGVLAHEISHIANGDMVTMTLLQGVLNAFVMFFARIAAFAISNALRQDDDEGEGLGYFAHMMVVMVLEVLFGLLAGLVLAWFSRLREFRADAGAAKLAGKGKMIGALEALVRYQNTLTPHQDAFRGMRISSKRSRFSLYATHPSLEDRIAALSQ